MVLLDWNEKTMALGIKLIDEQHKELLKIINLLAKSINENSQRKDILLIVEKLIDYVEYHFSAEEELFEKFHYEESKEHKDNHVKFTQKFVDIKNKITNDKSYLNMSSIDISIDIYIYMTNWFINHISGSDRKYASEFKKYGLE